MRHRSRFVEVAERVWVARHVTVFDVNVTVVAGERGCVLIDTHTCEPAAREVADALARLSVGPLLGIVNTHDHFDHVFGNAVFRDADPGVPIYAHLSAAERMAAAGAQAAMQVAAQEATEYAAPGAGPGDDPDPLAEQVRAARIVPADHVFTVQAGIDLGDREVVLRHLGRGHTGGDVVATVEGLDVLVAGDLIEQSAPPAYGPDSFPLDWPGTAARMATLVGPGTVVVPGHGACVDAGFVDRQIADLRQVAEEIARLGAAGADSQTALREGDWPWPVEALQHAVPLGLDAWRATG